MEPSHVIEKIVSASEARLHFGKLLREVETSGATFVIQKHGKAVAAIVPIRLYTMWLQEQKKRIARHGGP